MSLTQTWGRLFSQSRHYADLGAQHRFVANGISMGYILATQSWGRGYADLGAHGMISYAELGAQLRRVGGGTHADLGARIGR